MHNKHSSARLVILDHCLMQPDGHSMTLARAALDADPTCEVWANVNSGIDELRVRAVFPHSNMHPYVRIPPAPASGLLNRLRFVSSVILRTIRANRSFSHVLENGGNTPVIWFAVNGSSRNAFALLWRCWSCRADTGICYLLQDPGRWLKLAEGLRKYMGISNYHFAAETEELAERISRMMGGNCQVLPFPVPCAECLPTIKPQGRPLVAGFLGMPRREKGFDVLVKAIRLLGEETSSGLLKFRLQAPADYMQHEGMTGELAELSSMAVAGHAIECIGENLDSDAYLALLQTCDFLVIPYRTAAYARRSSLVPIEGLLYGKPLVMTHGLLVSASLPPNSGIVEFTDGDADGLAKAIKEMLVHFEAKSAETRTIQPEWRHRYTADFFISKLYQFSADVSTNSL